MSRSAVRCLREGVAFMCGHESKDGYDSYGDPGHRERMQGLEEERPHPSDEHRGISVDSPDRGSILEPAGLAGLEQLAVTLVCVRTDHAITDLRGEPAAKIDRGGCHWTIVPRVADYHPNVPEETVDDMDATGRDESSIGDRSDTAASDQFGDRGPTDRVVPRWVVPSVAIFWTGFLLTFVARHVFHRLAGLFILLLVAMFLALAIEPGVNKLAGRGWRRGKATITILLGVLLAFLAGGALVAAVCSARALAQSSTS